MLSDKVHKVGRQDVDCAKAKNHCVPEHTVSMTSMQQVQ